MAGLYDKGTVVDLDFCVRISGISRQGRWRVKPMGACQGFIDDFSCLFVGSSER